MNKCVTVSSRKCTGENGNIVGCEGKEYKCACVACQSSHKGNQQKSIAGYEGIGIQRLEREARDREICDEIIPPLLFHDNGCLTPEECRQYAVN